MHNPIVRINYSHPEITKDDRFLWKGGMDLPDGNRHEIFFNFTCPNPKEFRPSIKPFLLAYFYPAMVSGYAIQIDEPIGESLYQNLLEWQEAFCCWKPERLHPIPIRCPFKSLKNGGSEHKFAATSFSGGVDSCFTMKRQLSQQPNLLYRKTNLKAGIMFQGFDISIEDDKSFQSAFQRSRKILNSFNLDAIQLSTNIRSLGSVFKISYELETHGIFLAAALSCYESFFNQLLIPATYSYKRLRFPWASNPITDHFFSDENSEYVHDGAAFNKLEKVKYIADDPVISENLRVCWEGDRSDRNCGKCFKCVSTYLCFLLSGNENPTCFPEGMEFTVGTDHIPIRNDQNLYLFQEMLDEAISLNKIKIQNFLKRKILIHKKNRIFQRIRKTTNRYLR